MGLVMFEVGLFFFVVMFYFTIGYYYHLRYGILLSLAGVLLYFLGLTFGLGVLPRFVLLAIPLIIIMRRRQVTKLKFEKNKVYCTVCGWPNEPDAEFCRGLHCGAPITRGPDTSKWTYYLPPRLIVIAVAAVLLGMMLYETTRTGKFLVTLTYAAWPSVLFLIILILLYRKL